MATSLIIGKKKMNMWMLNIINAMTDDRPSRNITIAPLFVLRYLEGTCDVCTSKMQYILKHLQHSALYSRCSDCFCANSPMRIVVVTTERSMTLPKYNQKYLAQYSKCHYARNDVNWNSCFRDVCSHSLDANIAGNIFVCMMHCDICLQSDNIE